ncbi:hypothetical protein OEZ85_003885 [Tetradesmus obliquus]|uniref:Helicase C-terminal domain-containing protein n=1 Tax=Tetradesmus obliquus TaxID=3088 RepID=A0ABY8UI00_TETOB|nr:hypothetical protein OEZ85_003885 [Tetradesmus obliquus]
MEGRSAGLRQYYVGVSTVDAKLTTLVELLQALRVDTRLALAVACSSRDAVDAVVHALASCSGFNIAVLHADLEMHEVEQQLLQIKRRLQPPPAVSEGMQPAADEATRLGQQHEQQQQQQQAAAAGPTPAAAPNQQTAAAAAVQRDTASTTAAAAAAAAGPGLAAAADDGRSLVLVASDACLKGLPRDLLPLGLPLLIQYDLPASKDVLSRRIGAVFGSSKERGRRAGRQVVIDFVAAGEVAAFRARERLSSAPVMEMPVHVPDMFM